jgi:F0F1-type ATP synthase delta subunit
MNLEDFRKQKSAKVLSEHELDDDQLEKLIEEKFKRAKAYHRALFIRDEELVEQD